MVDTFVHDIEPDAERDIGGTAVEEVVGAAHQCSMNAVRSSTARPVPHGNRHERVVRMTVDRHVVIGPVARVRTPSADPMVM